MARYVLRYTGAGPVPAADLDEVRQRAHVVDAHGRMFLVEAPKARVQTLVKGLAEWVATPETVVPLPPSRPVVRATAKRPRRRSA
jgi:hypothetical protein